MLNGCCFSAGHCSLVCKSSKSHGNQPLAATYTEPSGFRSKQPSALSTTNIGSKTVLPIFGSPGVAAAGRQRTETEEKINQIKFSRALCVFCLPQQKSILFLPELGKLQLERSCSNYCGWYQKQQSWPLIFKRIKYSHLPDYRYWASIKTKQTKQSQLQQHLLHLLL